MPEDELMRRHIVNLADGIGRSTFVMTLSPGAEPDWKIALETGLAVLLDKPILAVGWPDRPVPPGLRRVARHTIELHGSMQSPETREELTRELKAFMESFVA